MEENTSIINILNEDCMLTILELLPLEDRIKLETVCKLWRNLSRRTRKGINILNEKCLVKILSYLPVKDRIRVERVSKFWRKASRKTWTKIKSLSSESPSNVTRCRKLNNLIFKQLLKRSAPNLKEISLSEKYHNDNLMALIAFQCKNLTSLKIKRLRSVAAFKILCNNFHELEDLELQFVGMEIIQGTEINKLFEFKRNLRKLCLNSIRSRHLRIPETVEDFSFSLRERFIPPEELIENLKRLRNLTISGPEALSLFPKFAQVCAHTLEHLRLEMCTSLTDQLFETFVKNFQNLKEISIISCWNLTERIFKCLALLPKLESLHYCNLSIYDGNFNYFFKCLENSRTLRKIELCTWSRRFNPESRRWMIAPFANDVKDETMCDVISALHNLHFLKLCSFDYSRNHFAVLKFVDNWAKTRNNGIVLQIIYDTDVSNFKIKSPFLKLTKDVRS